MELPAIEEIIADLSNDLSPLLRSRLIYLSNLDSGEMKLFEQVWAATIPKRRRQIVGRLVELAEDNFELNFDSIFRYGLNDDDAEVRSKVIEGLWESEDASLISPLVDLLERDSSEQVQGAAATALGKFAMLAELNKLRSCHASKVCRALLAAIDDESKPVEVRRRTLEAIAPFSIPEVTAAITKAYHSDNRKLKASAIYAMGKNCNPSWLPALFDELGSAEGEMRYEAAVACGELGEEAATPYLAKLINDPDINVQLATVQALGKIGGGRAKEWLKQCCHHASEAVREAAIQAFDELETEENLLSF